MTPIINREIFFGNPTIMGGKVSPNGEFISFIKPYEGMLNVWVKKRDEAFADAVPVTNDQKRPITSYFWSRDSQYILYVQDKGGDENFHLYAVSPESANNGLPESKDLTDYGAIRAMLFSLPKSNTDSILVGINDRDPAWHDLYELSISTGERKLIYQNEAGLGSFYFDLNNQLRLSARSTSNAGTEVLALKDNEWSPLLATTGDENISLLKFKSQDEVYVNTNIGNVDLSFLGILNVVTGEIEKVESDPQDSVDLGGALFSDLTNELIATVYTFEKSQIYWKDEDFESDYKFLKSHFNQAEISFVSGTKDQKTWIIGVNSDVDPGATYLFESGSKKVEFLYRPRPNLPLEHLSKMKPVSYTSTDDFTIHGYLSLPKDSEGPVPGIIMPHGGPWVRDTWGYHSYAQFLANRGYAVLQVNYRGSTGYGKHFLNAGDGEWGRKMQDDLSNGVKFLVEEGICNKDKIGILGGSYGGYATLAGLTFTPELYACGVSIVGPSNLFTLLESIPPYWEDARAMFHKRMGNPETEEGKAHLRAISPFFHAQHIVAPLLVGQGDNDPRVKTAESDQIVSAMQKHDLAVEYLNFPDEGHGFVNPSNSMAFIAAMEHFLAKHLGGRFQESIPDNLQAIIEKVRVV